MSKKPLKPGQRITRRDFLKLSAVVAGNLALQPILVHAKVFSAQAGDAPPDGSVVVDEDNGVGKLGLYGPSKYWWQRDEPSSVGGKMRFTHNTPTAGPIRMNWATWETPPLPVDGKYTIVAYIPLENANTSGAKYQIRDGAGNVFGYDVDQAASRGKWVEIAKGVVYKAGDIGAVYVDDVVPEAPSKRWVDIGVDAMVWLPPGVGWNPGSNLIFYDPRRADFGLQTWCGIAGEPVAASLGYFYTQHRDLFVPGPGLSVEFTRAYNSLNVKQGLFGRGWTCAYDMSAQDRGNGEIIVTFANGRAGLYVPAGGGRYTAPPAFFARLESQGDGWLLTDVDGTSYTFDGRGKLTKITDPNKNTISIAYEQLGFKLTDAVGREFKVENNGNGYVKSITDPSGRVISYYYDGDKLAKFVDARKGEIQYRYDGQDRMISITDPNGRTFISNEYDGQDRVIVQRDAVGTVSGFSYTDTTTTFTDNLGHKTIYEFDDKKRLVKETDHLGRSMVYEYDDNNNQTYVKDREGHETRMSYDERGNLLKVVDALGQESVFEYNNLNKLTYQRDASGTETKYQYDDLNFNLIVQTDALDGVTRMAYFSNGLIKQLANQKNFTTRFGYDSYGNLQTVTDALDHVTSYEYDIIGRRIKMTDANNHTVQFKYDENDRVIVITDPKGKATKFIYDSVGNLKRSIDRRGFPISYFYNENDSLVKVVDQRGFASRFEYDALYHRTKFINRRGHPTSYEYNEVYDLVATIDAKSNPTRFEYDANHNLIRVVDARSGETRYEYDALNRLTKMTNAMGGVTEYEYDPVGRLTQRRDPNTAVTKYQYDKLGRLKLVVDAYGSQTQFGYDRVGNRTQLVNARGFTTQYVYNKINQLNRQIDPLKHSTEWEYDGVGNLVTLTDRRGNQTRFEYDENDNLQKIIDALGGEASFGYDQEDNRTSAIDQNGHKRTFAYDKAGNLIKVRLPLGQETGFGYDENGNRVKEINAKKHVTRFGFDQLDLLEKRTTQMGFETRYQYDELRRMVQVTDAENNPTGYEYDPLGRMTAVTDALNNITRYAYDAVGNLTKHTDARNNATIFDVDLLGRVTGEHDAANHNWSYHYDEMSNRTERTDAKGQLTQYTFDGNDRLTQTLYPDGTKSEFAYDENNNLVKVRDLSGAEVFDFDALNRLIRTGRIENILNNKTVEFKYDPVGNRTAIKYPEAKLVKYEYNENDWLITVINPKINASREPGQHKYQRNALGQPVRVDNPNATWAAYGYDDDERLVSLFNGKPKASTDIISSFVYTLDRVGNRKRTVEQFTRGQAVTWTKDYTYDPLYRLRKAVETPDTRPYQVLTSEFEYDEVGNRLSHTTNIADKPNTPALPGPKTIDYEYGPTNRLLRAGDTRYDYDDNGNRTAMNGTERAIDYRYDYENRLIGAQTYDVLKHKRNADATLDFTYDALGRRRERGAVEKGVRKIADYLYDGMGYDLLAQYVSPGDPRTTYYYRDLTQVLSRHEIQGAGFGLQYFHHYDGLGNVSAWTSHVGRETQEYTYAPFGRLIDNNSTDNSSIQTSPHNQLTFGSKLWDQETELNYFGARDYDPAAGVWLTQDPYRGRLSEPMTLHRYGYVKNNPVNLADLYGFTDHNTLNLSKVPAGALSYANQRPAQDDLIREVVSGVFFGSTTTINLQSPGLVVNFCTMGGLSAKNCGIIEGFQTLLKAISTQNCIEKLLPIAKEVNRSQDVEKNLRLIIAEAQKNGVSRAELAYILATAHHESHMGAWMEEFASGNAYEGRGDLGNTEVGDGIKYKGRGFVQLTGRTNYQKYTDILGVDLINNPDAVKAPDVAAKILVHGMVNGTFTGKRLSDYQTDGYFDYVNARRIINGTDRAQDIANIAKQYYDELGDIYQSQ